MKNRAIRRHHRQRMIQRAKRFFADWGKSHGREWMDRFAARHADNLARCSCHHCGNRRRYDGKTIQERRQDLAMDDVKREIMVTK